MLHLRTDPRLREVLEFFKIQSFIELPPGGWRDLVQSKAESTRSIIR
jgi:hypothetical protein